MSASPKELLHFPVKTSKPYLSPKEAAQILDVHEETVLRWNKSKDNPLHARKIGGRWKIPAKEVQFT